MESLTQTMHRFCVRISSILKCTESSFRLSLVTLKYHRERPKRFRSLWYVCCKPCTYLALKLTLSPNGPKRDCTRPMSPRSSIGCIQNDFWASRMFYANRAWILRQDWHYLQMDWIELPLEPRHLGIPSAESKMISEPMVHLAQIVHLSCIETNTIPKQTESRLHLTNVT